MKFVYFGYDFMLGCVRRLISEGHELVAVFTFECDNVFNFNVETFRLAQSLEIPLYDRKPEAHDIEQLMSVGAEVFLAAGYPYKIPPIDEAKAYGVNLHPSLLPKGRGLMPTPTIIMHEPDAAGLTAHKIVPEIDGGDILDQMALPLGERENVETYSSRVAMAGPDMVSRIFTDIADYWRLAKVQDKSLASVFPIPDDQMRMIDWSDGVEDIDAKARAFGRFGCLAHLGSELWVTYDHDIWTEPHDFQPGVIVLDQPKTKVVAVNGGFFCIKDGHKLIV